MSVTAVVFIPAATNLSQHAGTCLAYCTAHGYQVAGVVTGTWVAAVAMLLSHEASVVVVARPEHIDPDREIRIESVVPDDGNRTGAMPASRRRPHIV